MAERNRPGDAGDPADDEVFNDDVVADDENVADDDAEPVGRGGTAVAERSAKPKKEVRRTGFFGRIGGFFREVVSELRKVIWPTRKELLTYTSIVIVFVARSSCGRSAAEPALSKTDLEVS
jgi:preprotein translocase subunit SecE